MQIGFELTASEYIEAAAVYGLRFHGLMATVAVVCGMGLLVPPPVAAFVWIGMILLVWVMTFRRLRQPGRKPSGLFVWGARAAAMLVWGLIAVAVLRHPAEADESRAFLVYPAFLMVIEFLATPLARLFHRSQWRSSQHLHGRQCIDVSDTGLIITRPQTSSTYTWSAIKGVQQTENLILLRVATAAFLIIPKRAFASQEQQAQFVALVQAQLLPEATLASQHA